MKIVRPFWILLAAALLAPSGPAFAQAYPNQVVRIVVPFSAGSITDGLARIVADRLGKMWNQQVIVENRPGVAGTTSVAKATPDGYTLMLTSNGHTIAGVINKNLQYDPVKDFAGITRVAQVPLVLIVPHDSPAKSLSELVALAKQKPGELNFSSAGVASTSFLAGEILRQNAQLHMQHVPYRGSPEAINAVIRADAQLYFAATIPQAKELGAAGKVKPLAINTAKRAPELPDVPTMAEAGMPDYKYESWFGVFAPAETPRPIVEKVSRDIASVFQIPEVTALMGSQGFVPAPTTPDEFDAINKNDTERYAKVLREAGVAAN